MRKRAVTVLGPVLLVALTLAVGAWSIKTTTSTRVVAAALPTPTPIPTIRVSTPRKSAGAFQAGISVVIYGNDASFQRKAQLLLNRLAGLHANSVSLVIPVFQVGPSGSEVTVDPKRTPSNVNIATFINEAHRRGFTVMIRPLLDIGPVQNPADWRGSIRPDDPARWQQTYRDLVISYARIAQANHVEVLNIGSELDSMEPDGAYWLGLVRSVRASYGGQVTYSSNWAKGYPGFGTALDFISIDSYFPLNRPIKASATDLATAWQPWISRMARIRRAFGKPLVLTEMGATSLVGSFQQPWIWDNGQPVDLTAQQRYYQAACQSVVPQFGGVYWWMYSLDPPTKPELDRSYAVAGKPAEADLKACFASP